MRIQQKPSRGLIPSGDQGKKMIMSKTSCYPCFVFIYIKTVNDLIEGEAGKNTFTKKNWNNNYSSSIWCYH